MTDSIITLGKDQSPFHPILLGGDFELNKIFQIYLKSIPISDSHSQTQKTGTNKGECTFTIKVSNSNLTDDIYIYKVSDLTNFMSSTSNNINVLEFDNEHYLKQNVIVQTDHVSSNIDTNQLTIIMVNQVTNGEYVITFKIMRKSDIYNGIKANSINFNVNNTTKKYDKDASGYTMKDDQFYFMDVAPNIYFANNEQVRFLSECLVDFIKTCHCGKNIISVKNCNCKDNMIKISELSITDNKYISN